MPMFQPKDPIVADRQYKVQKLSIPFQVVGSATSANVVLTCDEPSRMFLQSAAINQITAALLTNETATFATTTPTDSSGQLNILVRLNENAVKVMRVGLSSRGTSLTSIAPLGVLGSATGITTGTAGGSALMCSVASGNSHATAATFLYCLEVEYQTVK